MMLGSRDKGLVLPLCFGNWPGEDPVFSWPFPNQRELHPFGLVQCSQSTLLQCVSPLPNYGGSRFAINPSDL